MYDADFVTPVVYSEPLPCVPSEVVDSLNMCAFVWSALYNEEWDKSK